MNQRTAYLLQVLEKIGTPLMVSVLQAPGRGMADESRNDAQRMAELLARSTMASIEMSRTMDFAGTPDQGDSLRVALAALAGGLVGAYFKTTGKAPGDNDLKKIGAAMQTVLTYSDNFVPGADAIERLVQLEASGHSADPQQTGLQYISAFVPVVNAITAFPFGQPEQKLAMDVAARIIQKSGDLRKSLFAQAESTDYKKIELALVTVLAKIYAACHEAETQRLMSLTEEQRAMGGLGVDSIWKAFEIRAGIIEAMAQTLVPGDSKSATSGSKAPAPPPAVVAQKSVQPPAVNEIPTAPLPNPPPTGANPLSMFAKKPAGEGAPLSSPPQAPPQPENLPPVQDSGGSGNGSTPMSFFKAPPKKE